MVKFDIERLMLTVGGVQVTGFASGELGDVLWYLSALAQSIGSSLGEVAARNVAKLEARYPDGYVPGGGKR